MIKKTTVCLLLAIILWTLVGCAVPEAEPETSLFHKEYSEQEDGTWFCNGRTYQKRLVIRGRLGGADCDTEYIYLSNLPEITFHQAAMASGLGSNTEDYFDVKDAVLVEMK